VKVQWAWLTVLIALEVSGIVFLAATIIKTNKAKIAVLKSSSLASMCALSEESKEYIGASKGRGILFKNALGLEVKLERDESGRWQLERED
jgi:hypothetical protein